MPSAPTELQSFENVPVSAIAFDSLANGWADIPRQLLVDWLELLSNLARVIEPGYKTPVLPDPIEFRHETITSDGPYGSNENFYYLGYYSFETAGLLVHFEYGRHEGGEPLVMETSGLPSKVNSYLNPQAGSPPLARFYAWHGPELLAASRRALGMAEA